MARWSDCEMHFYGEKSVLDSIEKKAEEKDFHNYNVVDTKENELFITLGGSSLWANYIWFERICVQYGVNGKSEAIEKTI